jgi:hypothetical protein
MSNRHPLQFAVAPSPPAATHQSPFAREPWLFQDWIRQSPYRPGACRDHSQGGRSSASETCKRGLASAQPREAQPASQARDEYLADGSAMRPVGGCEAAHRRARGPPATPSQHQTGDTGPSRRGQPQSSQPGTAWLCDPQEDGTPQPRRLGDDLAALILNFQPRPK